MKTTNKTKNIMFVAHHNNDFDHFLPLIVHLKKYNKINCKIIAFYTEHEILKNGLHKYICYLNDINFDSMIDISYFKRINRGISKIYKCIIYERGLSNPSARIDLSFADEKNITEKHYNHMKQSILNLCEIILIRYFVFYSIFLLTNNKIEKYTDSNNINLAIIDHRIIEKDLLDSNSLTRFINIVFALFTYSM